MQKWFSNQKPSNCKAKRAIITEPESFICPVWLFQSSKPTTSIRLCVFVFVFVRLPIQPIHTWLYPVYRNNKHTETLQMNMHGTNHSVWKVQKPNSPQILRRFFRAKYFFFNYYIYMVKYLSKYLLHWESSLFVCFIGEVIWRAAKFRVLFYSLFWPPLFIAVMLTPCHCYFSLLLNQIIVCFISHDS